MGLLIGNFDVIGGNVLRLSFQRNFARWLLSLFLFVSMPTQARNEDLEQLARHLEAQAFFYSYRPNFFSREAEYVYTHLANVSANECFLKYKIFEDKPDSERKSSATLVQFSLADLDKVLAETSQSGAPSYSDEKLQIQQKNWALIVVFSYPAVTREIESTGFSPKFTTNVQTIYMASEGAAKKAAQLMRAAAADCKRK